MSAKDTGGSAATTFLCPDCDGYGATAEGCDHQHNDPACDCECMCWHCDESGVVQLERSEGERLGLHPWTGPLGRSLARVRIRHVDPLIRLADARRTGYRGRSVAYAWAKRDAMKPTLHYIAQRETDIGVVGIYRAMLAAQARAA